MQLVLQIITLIGSVAMLMYGLKVMSEGLQKMAGCLFPDLRSVGCDLPALVGCTPALPDNGIIYRSAVSLIKSDRRLPLVGDTDTSDIAYGIRVVLQHISHRL